MYISTNNYQSVIMAESRVYDLLFKLFLAVVCLQGTLCLYGAQGKFLYKPYGILATSRMRNSLRGISKSSFAKKLVVASCVTSALYYWLVPNRTLPLLEKLNVITLLPRSFSDEMPKDFLETKATVIHMLRKGCGVIKIKDVWYEIHRGIPDAIARGNQPVFMYAGGFSNDGNPYAFCAYTALKTGIITGPCVVFDCAADARRSFNFCQEHDLHCVELVYRELIRKAPQVRVILHGACKGGMLFLRFLAEQAEQGKSIEQIKAAVIESPPLSLVTALQSLPGGMLTPTLSRFVFPNYRPKSLKTIMDARKFPAIPILFGSLPKDKLSKREEVAAMSKHLADLQGKNGLIKHFVSGQEEIRHGRIGQAQDYREAVSHFLKQHSI